MRRPQELLVVGVVVALVGCGGGGGNKPDGASGSGGSGQAGTSGDAAAPDGDAGDAPIDAVVFSCADAGGGACNDNPSVSSVWGVCAAGGRCQCNAGFEVNPATGKCRPATTADGGTDTADGGDAPAAPLPAWQSGARLRATLLKAAATNDAVFQSVFDKDLGVACGFAKADDGTNRCMPSPIFAYFTDQGCTVPVAPLDAGCTVPTHVSRVASCQWSGWKLGAKVTPTKTYAFSPAGTCIEVPLTAGRDFYALTPVAATGFVAAAEHRDARGGGLEMRYWKSDDGGLFPIGAWDPARAASCVAGAGAYADRCIPGVVANVNRGVPAFSDNLCQQPLGYVENLVCGAEPPSAVGVLEPSACGQARAFVAATKYTGAVFRSQANTCFAWAQLPADWAFYTPGAAIAPSTLPAMTTALEGAGRLKVRRYATGATKPIDSQPALYDSTLADTCLLQQTSLGLRCLPSTTSGISFYADDKCTVPAHVESKTKPDPACAAPRPKVIYREKTAGTCGGLPTLELFAVGAAVTTPVIYTLNGTTCMDSGISPTVNDVFGTTPATDATTAALAFVTE